MVGVARSDLPSALRPGPRSHAPGAPALSPKRALSAQAAPRQQAGPPQGHGDDRRATTGGRRPRHPGHWEGDLLFGTAGHSQVGMVTERTTRFTMLFAIPYDRTAPTVRRALGRTIRKLPTYVARTVTWDQGSELAQQSRFTIDT